MKPATCARQAPSGAPFSDISFFWTRDSTAVPSANHAGKRTWGNAHASDGPHARPPTAAVVVEGKVQCSDGFLQQLGGGDGGAVAV
jgi:hypothetical protein